MATVTIKVEGLEDLKKHLDGLANAAATRVGKNTMRSGARVIVRHAKARAPVGKTGRLKNSIKVVEQTREQRLAGIVTAYAGTRLFYGRLLELGTSRMAPKAFLRPAADENGPAIRAKMEEILQRGLEREWRKQAPLPDEPLG
jgi:HK97 gp10 family phage protein